MSDIIDAHWTHHPQNAGAYWMRHNESHAFRICEVQTNNGASWMFVPGSEGRLLVTDITDNKLSFFGPLSLPEGSAQIFANAIYQQIDLPIDPTEG